MALILSDVEKMFLRKSVKAIGLCWILSVVFSQATAKQPAGLSAIEVSLPETTPVIMQSQVLGEDLWIDATNRETVRNFYRTVYADSDSTEIGWTGNYSSTNPASGAGNINQSFKDAVLLRVNFYRALVGVPAWISHSATDSEKAQLSSLAISHKGHLPAGHVISPDWEYYTEEGAEAAINSNLAFGVSGPQAIDGYVEDPGSYNKRVGHRRWLFYPQTQTMGTGDVPGNGIPYGQAGAKMPANTIWVQDDHIFESRPATRDEFVAYPTNGYTPYPLVFPRWSFSYPGANFDNATVSMVSNGTSIQTSIEYSETSESSIIGENTLVWVPSGLGIDPGNFILWETPDADVAYEITVSNVLINGEYRNFTYTATVFDPSVKSTHYSLPEIAGSTTPYAGQNNNYTWQDIPDADGYEYRSFQTEPLNIQEGAEGTNNKFLLSLTEQTTEGQPANDGKSSYTPRNGLQSYHLTMPTPEDQILQAVVTFIPSDSSELVFYSKLGYATEGQATLVEISTDEGASWDVIWSRLGNGGSGDSSYDQVRINLGQYANRTVHFRWVFSYMNGAYYPQSDNGLGWYIDDITVTHTTGVIHATTPKDSTLNSFNFNPSQEATYYLQVRSKIFNTYELEWSPILEVAAQPAIITDPIPELPTRLINISTRGFIGTGNEVMIGGFVVKGTGPSRFYVRAVGPSNNFQDKLMDPKLVIKNNKGETVASNDNWRDGQEQSVLAIGMPPTNDNEPAVIVDLPPGLYSAIISGVNGTTGIGSVEIYEVGYSGESKLINISTRGYIGDGNSVLIGGMAVSGDTGPTRLYIRALGATINLEGHIQNPQIRLMNQKGEEMRVNDDWMDAPEAAQIEALGSFAPSDPREAAMIVDLPPGLYTAIISGSDGSTGIGSVEVYEISNN